MANWIPKIEYVHPIDGATTITLTLPPENDPFPRMKSAVNKLSESSSGKLQTRHNFVRVTEKMKLVFLTLAQITALEKLFDDHAAMGGVFNWFPSNDEATYYTVTWHKPSFKPKRVTKSGADFIYDMQITLREEI